MRRMARVAYEAALLHYQDDIKRRLALHGERRSPPIELSVRTAFKVEIWTFKLESEHQR